MSHEKRNTPWVFWLVFLFGLFWNLGGVINYIMQTNLDYVASLPNSHQAIVIGRPVWATGGFAIGVFGGALGCLLMLFKKASAVLLFIISIIGIFITMVYTLQVVLGNALFSIVDIIAVMILPLVLANFLLGFSFYVIKRDWL